MHPRIDSLRIEFKAVSSGALPTGLATDALAGFGIPAVALVAGTALGGMIESWGVAWYALCSIVLATAGIMSRRILVNRFPEWSRKKVGKRFSIDQLQEVQMAFVLDKMPELAYPSVASRIIDHLETGTARRAERSAETWRVPMGGGLAMLTTSVVGLMMAHPQISGLLSDLPTLQVLGLGVILIAMLWIEVGMVISLFTGAQPRRDRELVEVIERIRLDAELKAHGPSVQ